MFGKVYTQRTSCVILRYRGEVTKNYIITGHYGAGKTNFSVNLALRIRGENPRKRITVCDFDIVNPYFRTADFTGLFSDNNIDIVMPRFANSSLDIPAITFDMAAESENTDYFIVDVGGDDAGAAALKVYRKTFERGGTEILYVVNFNRCLTKNADEALELLRDIEASAGLKHTAYVNNSNMGENTTAQMIYDNLEISREFSEKSGLPLFANTVNCGLNVDVPNKFPCEIFVKPIWSE